MLAVGGTFSCLTAVAGAWEWSGFGLSMAMPVAPDLAGAGEAVKKVFFYLTFKNLQWEVIKVDITRLPNLTIKYLCSFHITFLV